MKNIFSKVAIVTGASKGLGASISLELAKEKFKVVLVYRKSTSEAKNAPNPMMADTCHAVSVVIIKFLHWRILPVQKPALNPHAPNDQ